MEALLTWPWPSLARGVASGPGVRPPPPPPSASPVPLLAGTSPDVRLTRGKVSRERKEPIRETSSAVLGRQYTTDCQPPGETRNM